MSENKILLSFDVELWNETAWLNPYITKDLLEKDTFPESINKILGVLRKTKSSATFFVTLEVTEKYPEIIKNIYSLEHEIGIHGPRHKKLKDYSKEEFKTDCIKQIKLIEEITGKRPVGYRAPHFSVNRETFWAIETLKDLGFLYDSSIFPMNMGEYGISGIKTTTHEILPNFSETPVSVAQIGPFKTPFAGGIYFRALPYFIFKFLLKNTLKKQNVVLYFHPHELESSTPKIKSGPWLKRKLKYFGINSSFRKFEKLANCYIFESVNDTFLKL